MLNEELLHFIWKHRFLPLKQLKTLTDQPLEIINPGLYNSNAGPDFLNAKIKIGRTIWAGNVELHLKAEDWYVHRHHENPAYDSVILHVALESQGTEIKNSKGEAIPQLLIEIPEYLQVRYQNLKVSKELIPCRSVFHSIPVLEIHSWIERLLVERLEERCQRILCYYLHSDYDWTAVFFISLARAFGFGKNGYIFEKWAQQLPFTYLPKHCSDLGELEAIFLGTAGLLTDESGLYLKDVAFSFESLQREYSYLKHKYNLREVDFCQWKYLRTRPSNFPHLRILQLAVLYQKLCYQVTDILDGNLDFKEKLKELRFSPEWKGTDSLDEQALFHITDKSIQLLEINCIIPLKYAVGKYKGQEGHMQSAIDQLNKLKPEKNHIIQIWIESGLEVKTASDSQALLQLQNNYCDKKDCLRCCFGMEYMRCR